MVVHIVVSLCWLDKTTDAFHLIDYVQLYTCNSVEAIAYNSNSRFGTVEQSFQTKIKKYFALFYNEPNFIICIFQP